MFIRSLVLVVFALVSLVFSGCANKEKFGFEIDIGVERAPLPPGAKSLRALAIADDGTVAAVDQSQRIWVCQGFRSKKYALPRAETVWSSLDMGSKVCWKNVETLYVLRQNPLGRSDIYEVNLTSLSGSQVTTYGDVVEVATSKSGIAIVRSTDSGSTIQWISGGRGFRTLLRDGQAQSLAIHPYGPLSTQTLFWVERPSTGSTIMRFRPGDEGPVLMTSTDTEPTANAVYVDAGKVIWFESDGAHEFALGRKIREPNSGAAVVSMNREWVVAWNLSKNCIERIHSEEGERPRKRPTRIETPAIPQVEDAGP